MSRHARLLMLLALTGSSISICDSLAARAEESEPALEQAAEISDLNAPEQSADTTADYYDETTGATPEATPLKSEATDATDEAKPLDSQPADDAKPITGPVETFTERFASGKPRIEREVAQDNHGNYINHGAWAQRNERGQVIAEGRYAQGEREGTWNRWLHAKDADLLGKAPYSQFKGPYISQADFTNGELDGTWTIFDSKQHKISRIEFVKGQRHGVAVWWYATGKLMRQARYRNGHIDGDLIEYSPEGKVTLRQAYQDGRKLAPKSTKYANGAKKSQGMYLHAREIVKTADDWAETKLATYMQEGSDDKHGPWTSWYSNGQKQIEGQYSHNLPTGGFTWWHANSQVASEGGYEEGKTSGRWVWWHQNGQKSISGEYVLGVPSGKWSWWNQSGELSKSADLNGSESEVARTEIENDSANRPSLIDPNSEEPKKR